MDKNNVDQWGLEVIAALEKYMDALKKSPHNLKSLRAANEKLETAIEKSAYFKSSNDKKAVIREFLKTTEKSYKPVYEDMIRALEQRRIAEARDVLDAPPAITYSKNIKTNSIEKRTIPAPNTDSDSKQKRNKP